MQAASVAGLVVLAGALTLALVCRLIIYFADHGVQPVNPTRFETDPATKRDMDELINRMNGRYIAATRVAQRVTLLIAAAGLILLVIGVARGGRP
jgi:hypothetical protein